MVDPTPLLILDIDGTVRQGKDDPLGRFVNSVADVRVFPAAVVQMRKWKANGGRIIGVSNQGGIAAGYVEASAVAAAMLETERQCVGTYGGALFDGLQWCPHAPDSDVCWCRKPRPGLVYQLLYRLQITRPGETFPPLLALLVGDRPEDEALAERLGVKFESAEVWRLGGVEASTTEEVVPTPPGTREGPPPK